MGMPLRAVFVPSFGFRAFHIAAPKIWILELQPSIILECIFSIRLRIFSQNFTRQLYDHSYTRLHNVILLFNYPQL